MQADELKALKLRIDESEAVLREARSEETQQLAAGKKVHQETKRLEAALEAIAIKQSEILKTAQMEQVISFSDPLQSREDWAALSHVWTIPAACQPSPFSVPEKGGWDSLAQAWSAFYKIDDTVDSRPQW